MRLRRISLVGLIFLLTVIVTVPAVALAGETRSGEETVLVARDEIVNDDLYAAGSTVTISGTVNGDVIVVAGTVNIDGTVNGDVWVASGTLNVSGKVADDVRVASGTTNVSGMIVGDLLSASGQVTVGRSGIIGQDVWVTSGDLTQDGTVGRDLKANAGTATVSGIVKRDINAHVDTLRLGSQSQVGGNVTYSSGQELRRDEGAVVGGQVDFKKQQEKSNGLAGEIWSQLYWFLASVLLLLAIMLYGRRAAVIAADHIGRRPWVTLLAGFVFVIVTPIVALIILITLVGLPISLFTLLFYGVVIYSAKVFVSLFIGHAILRQHRDAFWFTFGAGVLGLAAYYILTALPFIGFPVQMLTVFFGTGAQILLARELYRDNRQKYGV